MSQKNIYILSRHTNLHKPKYSTQNTQNETKKNSKNTCLSRVKEIIIRMKYRFFAEEYGPICASKSVRSSLESQPSINSYSEA